MLIFFCLILQLLESFFILMVLTLGSDNFCLIHVSLVPVLNVVGEQVNFSETICLKPF